MENKMVRLNNGKKHCKECGASGLYWVQSKKGNWVLWEEVAEVDSEGFAGITETRPHYVHCGADVENTAPAPKAEKPVEAMDTETKAALLQCLQFIAGQCDGANRNDGVGFSRYDARFGHDLARRDDLTDRQAVAAQKMVRKYRGQLQNAGHTDLAVQAGIAEAPKVEKAPAPVEAAPETPAMADPFYHGWAEDEADEIARQEYEAENAEMRLAEMEVWNG